MKKSKKPIVFTFETLPACEHCKNHSAFFYTLDNYLQLVYICPDCAYDKGLINGYGFFTRGGELSLNHLILK